MRGSRGQGGGCPEIDLVSPGKADDNIPLQDGTPSLTISRVVDASHYSLACTHLSCKISLRHPKPPVLYQIWPQPPPPPKTRPTNPQNSRSVAQSSWEE
jgi:hypothetical protein